MMSGKLTIFASGNKAELDNILPKQQADALAEHVRNKIAPGQSSQGSSAVATMAPSRPDVYDRLRKLGELRDAGVLTPEEFDAKKASLLADM